VLNIGWGEMLVVLLVAMIVFGPNRLPEIARSLGKFIRNFQAETNRAIGDLKAGLDSPTAGIFDEPDANVTAAEGPSPNSEIAFTPAAELAAATKTRNRKPAARSSKPAARSATTTKKGSATKGSATKRPAASRKKPASKRAPSARRSPKRN
jgi:TatA/E family protein of Tat protein translocase